MSKNTIYFAKVEHQPLASTAQIYIDTKYPTGNDGSGTRVDIKFIESHPSAGMIVNRIDEFSAEELSFYWTGDWEYELMADVFKRLGEILIKHRKENE